MAESWLDFVRSKFQQPEQRSVMDPAYQPMNQGNALRAGLARGAMDVSPLALADAPMGGLKTMPLAKIIAQRLGIPMESPTEKLAATLGIQKPGGSPYDPNARQASAGWEFGRSAAQAAPAAAWQMANAAPTKSTPQFTINQDGQIVWHGSPHKFDKFDASKIGTGEGAQAYGHGLYLAESPGVAKSYQQKLATNEVTYEGALYKPNRAALDPKSMGLNALSIEPGPIEAAKKLREAALDDSLWVGYGAGDKSLRPKYLEAAVWLEQNAPKITVNNGSLYKVDLPDSAIAKMLDWDKPINQQSDMVKDLLEKAGINSMSSAQAGPMARSQELHLSKFGIPGIRYLDGGSRGAGAGTSNFVVFPGNESLLQILERNGVPLK